MTKPNMSLKKNPMPSQEPQVRAHNFNEVATGYTEETALDEALRCLSCKNMPCVSGCPVNIHIPEFIAKIKEGDFEGAYRVISKTSSLPAVCGRVCPQETQCESKCVRGIKASLSASAGSSALLRTGTTPTAARCLKLRLQTATASQLWAPALPG